jgi:beta-lactamase regulating signal transducer with metallopeptidase domain
MIFTLIEAALRSLLVAAAVWAGLRTLQVSNVLVQKIAWALVLLSALVMPVTMRWQAFPHGMSLVLPAKLWQQALAKPEAAAPMNAIQRPAPALSLPDSIATEGFSSAPRTSPIKPRRSSVPATSNASAPVSLSANQAPPPAHTQQATPRRSLPQPAALAALLYFTVCGALLLRLLIGFSAAIRLWLKADPVECDSLPLLFSRQALRLRVRSSRAISSPVTIGSGVLLPASFTAWDTEKLRIVLAHENSHVRQGDFYLQLLAELYTAMFWFSPLGWWLKRKLCDLSETISDRAGLGAAASGPSYAQVLLEFAAAPRLTMRGVAMARPNNLSRRIERLLNESTFRQACAGGRRRAMLAVLLVPAALFAASALIRVEAASQTEPAPIAVPQPAPDLAPQAPEAAINAPLPPAPPDALPAPLPATAPSPVVLPGLLPPLPPSPPAFVFAHPHDMVMAWNSQEGHDRTNGFSYNYSYSDNGETYALISRGGEHTMSSGDWHGRNTEAIEKARKMAHGDFLWFMHGGKSYLVDEPAIVSQIQAMYKPMEELGKKQEELGKQQEALGKQQEEIGRKMENATFPTPDMSKEIAELEQQMEKLKTMQGKTMTTEEWAEVESKLGNLQGKLGAIQGEIGAKQGSFGGEMGKLGAMQGRLGAQQGKLGAEQGRLAQQANRQVKSIIDQSLSNGKARPVE